MPRNGSGIYNLPSGNPVTSGTTVTTAWANTTLPDIGNEITNSLPRDGSAPLTGGLKITDGAVSAPSIKFSSEETTGLYRSGSHELAVTVGGILRTKWTDTGLNNVDIGETTRGSAKVTTLDANGAVTFGTTLGVTGNTTLGGNLALTGNAVITGTLTVTGGTAGVTKAMVGLGNADNTSDANKPVSIAVQALFDSLVKADRRGTVFARASTTVPAGAFACDGTAYSRTTYAALFAVVGTAYGAGDGSTTFNVPDLRGEFLRGVDSGRGVDAGRVLGSSQVQAFISHAHGVSDPTHAHSLYDPGHAHGGVTDTQGYHGHGFTRPNLSGLGAGSAGLLGNLPNSMEGASTDGAGSHAHNLSIYGSGTGMGVYGAGTGISIQASGGAETRPRNVAVLYCIWY